MTSSFQPMEYVNANWSEYIRSTNGYIQEIWEAMGWLSGKESAYNVDDMSEIPGSGRSPGEGNADPLQYSPLHYSNIQNADPLQYCSQWGRKGVQLDWATKQRHIQGMPWLGAWA